MTRKTVQARVSSELKKDSEAVFKSLGLNTSEAIRLFLKKTVAAGGLPFESQKDKSNPRPRPAMEAAEKPERPLPVMDSKHLLSDTGDEIEDFCFGK